MAARGSSITTLLVAFFIFSSTASAFNITRILDQTPEFSTFNTFLTQTKLAADINRRQTITVLAVDNPSISAVLSGQPLNVIREILSVHVILDYYDARKIWEMKRKSTTLTTMFQATGLATNEMGFIKLAKTESGIRLGSAVPGAGLTVSLVKTVLSRPYNISVLQVSGVIVPPGVHDTGDLIAAPPPPAPANAAPAPEEEAPAPASEAESPDVASPPSPADAPEADVPSPVLAPAPAPSEDASPAEELPADQEEDAPSPSDESTSWATREAHSGSRIATTVVGAVAAALLAAL